MDEDTEAPLRTDCAETLCRHYDVALLDLDGVVYLSSEVIASAPPALKEARSAGMRLAFVTNNASRRPAEVAELLQGMGVPASAEDVVTSAQAAAHRLADLLPPDSTVLVVGADALSDAIAERGLRPVRSADPQPAAVVQGFDRGVDWAQLAEATVAMLRGAPWVLTNADATIPSMRGTLPGNGALAAALRTATKIEPQIVGKPEVQLHHDSVVRTDAQRPLVVGDRLDTDILGARNGGADSLLVLTGITDARALLGAPSDQRPTYLGADLGSLLSSHQAVSWQDGTASCAGFHARRVDDDLELSSADGGSSDPVDALRALCVAWWQPGSRAAGDGETPKEVRGVKGRAEGAIEQLGLSGPTSTG